MDPAGSYDQRGEICLPLRNRLLARKYRKRQETHKLSLGAVEAVKRWTIDRLVLLGN